MAKRGRELIPMVGKEFGWLTVTEFSHFSPKGHVAYWVCECKCGATVITNGGLLRRGGKTSCKCKRPGTSRDILLYGRLYKTWDCMKTRCYNPNSPNYKWYGARDVHICPEWRNNFKAFESWALSHGYEEGLTIDRVNPDGDYCPENCRFLTREANSSKRSRRTKEQIAQAT